MNTIYTYDESQVRRFSEEATTLTPLETLLLERLDTLQSQLEEEN